MSLSSITNRLTMGQYYEMVYGVKAAREGKRIVVIPGTSPEEHTETVLYDGPTGDIIMRRSDDKTNDQEVRASWGICRVWEMTQKSWDKQHYTHNTEGLYSTSTKVGRTAGGGLRNGEMENHAVDGSGLTKPIEEMKERVDSIIVDFCTNCNQFLQHGRCGEKEHLVKVSIPFPALMLAHATVITSGHVMKFNVDIA
jgi:DNA-directed RNA polymerase beta subunit